MDFSSESVDDDEVRGGCASPARPRTPGPGPRNKRNSRSFPDPKRRTRPEARSREPR